MKTLVAALLALTATLAAAPPPAQAADARNVTVVNETGYAIKFLGFNGPDDGLEEWDNELEGVLRDKGSTYVTFDDDDDGCVWNIKIEWAEYNEAVLWRNVNLCRMTALR